MYALVQDDQIQSVGRLPNAARRLDTQEWVLGLDTAPPELVQATGWYEVVDTARPDDTATTTHDRSVELVNGVPTVVWTERAKTQAELDAETQQANRSTIETQARNHLADLRLITGSSGTLSGANLSNAVRTLAQGQIRVIRLLLNEMDGTA